MQQWATYIPGRRIKFLGPYMQRIKHAILAVDKVHGLMRCAGPYCHACKLAAERDPVSRLTRLASLRPTTGLFAADVAKLLRPPVELDAGCMDCKVDAFVKARSN